MARNFAPTFEGQVEQLERIRHDGNKQFAEGNWTAAIIKYSECIALANTRPDLNALHSNPTAADLSDQKKDEFLRVFLLAFSNRLRLQAYAAALADAEWALEIDPKHVKTLVRKGRALHALQLYDKACEAFQCALAESPEEQSSIRSSLKASSVAASSLETGVMTWPISSAGIARGQSLHVRISLGRLRSAGDHLLSMGMLGVSSPQRAWSPASS